MSDLKKLVGTNFTMPTLKIRHAGLSRLDPKGSIYRTICPTCKEGLLLVQRDNDGKLMEKDHCTLCAQSYEYTDIEKMRERGNRL